MSRLFLGILVMMLTGCGASIRQAGEGTPTGHREPMRVSGRGAVARLASNQFRVECREFQGVAVEQESDVWCWAAAAQMIHRYQGREIEQRDIAERIHGRSGGSPEKARAAGYAEMVLALSPEWHERLIDQAYRQVDSATIERLMRGQVNWQAMAETALNLGIANASYDSEQMVADISQGLPMVTGLVEKEGGDAMGHIYVIYAMTYSQENPPLSRQLLGEATPTYSLHSVEAIDPWTGQSVAIPASKLAQQMDFILTQQRSEELLRGASQSLRLR